MSETEFFIIIEELQFSDLDVLKPGIVVVILQEDGTSP